MSGHSGWLIYLLSLTCALVIGSAIRLFFSPDQLAIWIHQSLDRAAPPVEVTFSQARLSLSEGWIPRMGVLITGIKITPADPCAVDGEIDIDEMFVPLSLREIFRENLQFTTLQIRNAQVRMDRGACANEAQLGDLRPARSWSNAVQVVREFLDRRWMHEMMNTRKWMRGLVLDHLSVELRRRGDSKFTPLVSVHDFSWFVPERPQDMSMAKFTLSVPKEQLGGLELRPLLVHLQIQREKLWMEGRAQHQEGRIGLNVEWRPQSDELVGKLELKNLPAKSLVVAAREAGWIPIQLSSRQAWVSCDISIEAQLHKLETWRGSSQKCRSEGDYGAATIESAQIRSRDDDLEFEVDFVLDQIDLDKVMQDIASNDLKAFVKRAGRLSGRGKVGGEPLIHFEGELKSGELSFPSAVPGQSDWHQRVSSARTQASWSKGRFSGLIDAFSLDKGDADAQFTFNFSDDFSEGLASLQVRKLKLPSEVFSQLINGQAESVEVYGQARWREGAWQDWDGRLGWSQYRSPDLKVERWKMAASGSKGQSHGTISASNLRLEDKNPWAQALTGAIGRVKAEAGGVSLKSLEGKWHRSPEGWSWEKVWAQSDLDSALLASTGRLSQAGDLAGEITMDLPYAKALQWEIQGHSSKPQLRPLLATEQKLMKRKKKEAELEGSRDTQGP